MAEVKINFEVDLTDPAIVKAKKAVEEAVEMYKDAILGGFKIYSKINEAPRKTSLKDVLSGEKSFEDLAANSEVYALDLNTGRSILVNRFDRNVEEIATSKGNILIYTGSKKE